MKWDIFSPPVKQVLWGTFNASVALGAFGAAISAVLGIQEVVKALRRMAANSDREAGSLEPEAPRRHYLAWMAVLLAVTACTVVAVHFVNRHVERQRIAVFKLLVRDQMKQLEPTRRPMGHRAQGLGNGTSGLSRPSAGDRKGLS